jgi:hypothetical protein
MAAAGKLREEIGARLLAGREPLAEEMTDRIRSEVSEFEGFEAPELWEALRDSCLANLEMGLWQLTRGGEDRFRVR